LAFVWKGWLYLAIEIPLKGNTVIIFDDVIQLTPKQLAKILEQSPLKTEMQWLQPKTKGVKIKFEYQVVSAML
jgi:hypothetical protein